MNFVQTHLNSQDSRNQEKPISILKSYKRAKSEFKDAAKGVKMLNET